MKIALVLDDTLDRPDGVQQYVLTLGSWLTRHGHNVFYLCANTKRTDIQDIYSLGAVAPLRFNGNTVRTPLPSISDVKKLLGKIQPDIVHVQMPYSPFLAGRVISAVGPDVGVVGTFHILPMTKGHTAANKLLRAMLLPTLHRFNAVMAVSEPAGEFAQSAYGLKSKVVPNAIDGDQFRVKHDSGSNQVRVVFLGRLVERKGVLDLISAFLNLPESASSRARLVIGGYGPLLEKAMARVGGSSSVEFSGFIEDADKARFLASGDVAVFPSLGGESFGIVLLEAIASGTPVLAANNHGYSSVLGSVPASLFPAGDVEALTKSLEKFITDASFRRVVHTEQKALLKNYDIDVVGPKIVRIYEESRHSELRAV